MNNETKREQKAAERLHLILPLLNEEMDKAAISQEKIAISQQSGVGIRTLDRYIVAYRQKGFEGLKPKVPVNNSRRLPKNFPDILKKAEDLRLEVPGRSVNTIIRILEMEGVIKPGEIKRSTLQDHLAKEGFSSKRMKLTTRTTTSSRRFQKKHRGQLWQGDIKYGPYLPIGTNGKMKQTYLSVIIDDATRYVVFAKFYDNMETAIIEDSLRNAVMGYGLPQAIYFDNGKQYKNKWIQKICDRLGTRLMYAKPYSPESKGKVEAFNRTIDAFYAEIAIDKPKSLPELNYKLDLWINQYYHKKPHSALNERTPEVMFKSDTAPLKFASNEVLQNAFLHSEERKVNKSGCVSLYGREYEAGLEYIGRTVEVLFDPNYLEEIEIRFPGFAPKRVRETNIGEFCGFERIEHPQKVSVENSRFLSALEKEAEKHHAFTPPVLSFSSFLKEETND